MNTDPTVYKLKTIHWLNKHLKSGEEVNLAINCQLDNINYQNCWAYVLK